jgi:uncharacterized membrane protein YhiD involved in acid resistance
MSGWISFIVGFAAPAAAAATALSAYLMAAIGISPASGFFNAGQITAILVILMLSMLHGSLSLSSLSVLPIQDGMLPLTLSGRWKNRAGISRSA